MDYYQKADGKTKNNILSCILSEKITFDENKDAAISFVTPIQILLNASKGFKRGKKEKEIKNDLLSYWAPRRKFLSNQFYLDIKLLSDLYLLIMSRLKS